MFCSSSFVSLFWYFANDLCDWSMRLKFALVSMKWKWLICMRSLLLCRRVFLTFDVLVLLLSATYFVIIIATEIFCIRRDFYFRRISSWLDVVADHGGTVTDIGWIFIVHWEIVGDWFQRLTRISFWTVRRRRIVHQIINVTWCSVS